MLYISAVAYVCWLCSCMASIRHVDMCKPAEGVVVPLGLYYLMFYN